MEDYLTGSESDNQSATPDRPDMAIGSLAVLNNSNTAESAATKTSSNLHESTFGEGVGRMTGDIDSVSTYLNQIGQTPLLTADGEKELARTIEAGHKAVESGRNRKADLAAIDAAREAKTQFIQANLRLVVSIAKRYPLPQGIDLSDLIQEGNLGLEHAVDKFDWQRGFKFSTYATFWIRQAIGRALDQKGSLIRIPGDRSSSLRAALREAKGEGEQLDAANAELHKLTTTTSLDKRVGEDGDASLGDLMASDYQTPEDIVMAMVDRDLIGQLLDRLDGRPRYAVEARFGLLDGEQRSFREVGEGLGVTAEAARRMVGRAISELRDGPVIQDLLSD